MTTTAPVMPVAQPLSREEIRRATNLSLAADLIERGLNGPLGDLHITLIQLADSSLLPENDTLRRPLERLCEKGEALTSQAGIIFPASRFGGAAKLRLSKCHDLPSEVDLYRQEQFWTRSALESLIQAENLIAEMFRFYAEAGSLMREIDDVQPNGSIIDRRRAPQYTANPYEDAFARKLPSLHEIV